jgi:hypothetical protein
MADTTSAEATELIIAKIVDSLLIWYQYDTQVAAPFFRFRSIVGQATSTASFPRRVKNVHTDFANESASLTPVAWNPTAVDIAVSRIGIARAVSETLLEDNILGRALLTDELVMDASIILGEAMEEDATAEFANATNSVSDTNVAIEIIDLVEGVGLQRAAKVRGQQVIHLHDINLKQLQRDLVASTKTTWAAFYQPNNDETGYGGTFMNAPIFASSKNPTANAAVDRVGCIWARGDVNPAYCAFGHVLKRAPRTKFDEDILADMSKMATISRQGYGTPAPNFATKLIFKNG